MRRGVANLWHSVSFLLAGGLFFLFVLPRWPELAGDITPAWGTVLRIVTGVLLALTALPVALTLRKSRRPEFGTPELANRLRLGSIVGHLLAAVLIVVTAVVEIWITLDDAGQELFGVYGAAATIAVLSAVAFYLAYLAELSPPAPKPLKAKKAPAATPEATEVELTETAEVEVTEVCGEMPVEADTVDTDTDAPDADTLDAADADEPRGGLRNKRPVNR